MNINPINIITGENDELNDLLNGALNTNITE
jgi:hypothetical protein